MDIDSAQFFDHVHHDMLMRRIAAVMRDKPPQGGSAFGGVGRGREAAGERGRRLGVSERLLGVAPTRRGAWFMSRTGLLHRALSNAVLKRYGLLVPSDLAACG